MPLHVCHRHHHDGGGGELGWIAELTLFAERQASGLLWRFEPVRQVVVGLSPVLAEGN